MTSKDSDFDSKEIDLIEKINQASGDQLSELRAELLEYYFDNGWDAYKIQDYKKAFEFWERGLTHAESFLELGETQSAVRELVLKLYGHAGLIQGQAPFNDAAQAFELYQRGLTHAEIFLEQGETHSAVREMVLKLYVNSGGTQGQAPFNDAAQAFELYQRGLTHAENFLQQGETLGTVREWVLNLYGHAGVIKGRAPFNDAAQAFELYQRGLTHAESFLEQGETHSAVREQVLNLYVNAGFTQEQAPFNDAALKMKLYQRGLTHAESFLEQGETQSAVRKQVLKLYFNAGFTQGQAPFNDAAQAFELYQRGLTHAESFLEQGETLYAVREVVLNLYFNAGVTQGKAPFNDAAQAFELYQRGLTHAESFLQQGETQYAVREQVLKLYVNAGITQGQAPFNDAAQEMKLYQRGLRHAEKFLEQGETLSAVREPVLKLYSNAGFTQGQAPFNDAAQAFELYQRGLTHAESFLQQGETQSAVRNHVLELYFNVGVTQGKAPFNDAAQEMKLYQRGLTHAESFLEQGETLGTVRELVLKLYIGAGVTQGQAPFNDAAQEMKLYQRGLKHAESFLEQGETLSAVRELVLGLYYSISSTYGNSGQTRQQIQFLPILGLWSWVSLNKTGNRQRTLHSWSIHLRISINQSDFATITAAFRDLLHQLLLIWHNPQRPHRHFQFITTETLLAISESLYGIEQAEENQGLHSVYHHLQDLQNLPEVQDILNLHKELLLLENQQHKLITLKPDKNLWWHRLLQWLKRHQLAYKIQNVQQQIQQNTLSINDDKVEKALVIWMKKSIQKRLRLPTEGLNELPVIVLGMLLASQCIAEESQPEAIVETWQNQSPWQDIDNLKSALAPSKWQDWCNSTDPNKSHPPLYSWQYSLDRNYDVVHRLILDNSKARIEQPDLQDWLHELSANNAKPLSEKLSMAWDFIQKPAQELAQILTALAKPNFQGNLFAKREFESSTYHQALAMLILGDAPKKIEFVIQNWLEKQAKIDQTTVVLDTIHALKHRLNRAVSIYQPKHPNLGEAVHNWSKVLLEENLQDSENIETIWQILERSRIGLVGLTMKLPDNWDINLGKELWYALRETIEFIKKGNDTEEKMWPLLTIWFKHVNSWFLESPTIDTCKQHLQAKQALVQPFFDGKQLQILWLDKTGLSLKQLPDSCAEQQLWSEKSNDSVINQWTRYFEDHKRGRRGISGNNPNWEKVMQTEPVQKLADTLKQWAAQLEQITIIFPAPLGQLPWEILPQLENILVREISLGHWLKSPLTPLYERGELIKSPLTPLYERRELIKSPPLKKGGKGGFWVTSDPQGQAQCMVKEGQWVAKQFNTELENPCPSVFDALHHLANQKQAHICTHGKFDRYNPLASGLILQGKTDTQPAIKLPLWTSTQLPSTLDIIMLSACESNLNGQQTSGLLAPIGIGPSLAAAGVKTVVGTLWPCNGLATLCFNYYFYKIAQKNPQMPWHIVAAEARKSLKEMRRKDLQYIAKQLNLQDKNDQCHKSVNAAISKAMMIKQPFKHFSYWAPFSVLGNVQRQ